MKKMRMYSINLLLLFFVLTFNAPASAQSDNDRKETRKEKKDRDNLRDEDDSRAREDNDDNYGWIGLIGLAGLAGLLRRPEKRIAHTDTGFHSTGTGRTDLGGTDTNRTV